MNSNTGIITAVSIVAAVIVATVSGHFWGGWEMAITFGLVFGAFGFLIIGMYELAIRFFSNHVQHLFRETVLVLRFPGIGKKPADDVKQAWEDVKKDFETAEKIVNKS